VKRDQLVEEEHLQKSYESVPLCRLLESLTGKGIDAAYIEAVRNLYEGSVKMYYKSEEFWVTRGLNKNPELHVLYLKHRNEALGMW
jgi:hypothetical protein